MMKGKQIHLGQQTVRGRVCQWPFCKARGFRTIGGGKKIKKIKDPAQARKSRKSRKPRKPRKSRKSRTMSRPEIKKIKKIKDHEGEGHGPWLSWFSGLDMVLDFLIFGSGHGPWFSWFSGLDMVLDFLGFLVCGSASYVVSKINADFLVSMIADSEVGSGGGGDYWIYKVGWWMQTFFGAKNISFTFVVSPTWRTTCMSVDAAAPWHDASSCS